MGYDRRRMEQPYLEGAYAPIVAEITARDMPVIGEVPRDLAGVYVRNGPNRRWQAPGRYHWFDGDGMLHAAHVQDGRVTYRNRWIRTPGLAAENEAGRALWTGLLEPTAGNPAAAPYKDTGNTDVLLHRDRLLTLWYVCGAAHRVHPGTLQTEGVETFGRARPLRMSAHARVDEHTGELMFFDYGPTRPYMRYGVVDAQGQLAHRIDVDLPGARLPHDMAITEHYSVLMDLPVFHRPDAAKAGRWIVDYHRELPARFGVVPRHGSSEQVRWFCAEPCYIYHVVNAWEEGDSIVMVGCRCIDPTPEVDPADGAMGRMLANLRLTATLHRWRFDLSTGQTHEEPLDDLAAEFPVIDTRRMGRPNRFSYHVTTPKRTTLQFEGVAKYDLSDGSRTMRSFGGGVLGSEVAFAPRIGATEEDDGYLLTFVDDRRHDRSELWIVDARALGDGPVARVEIPQRVHLGFHACWVPEERLPT